MLYILWSVLLLISIKNNALKRSFSFFFSFICAVENWLHFFAALVADLSAICHTLSSKSLKQQAAAQPMTLVQPGLVSAPALLWLFSQCPPFIVPFALPDSALQVSSTEW